MRHKTLRISDKRNDFICQQIRFYARNAEAVDAFHFVQFLYQINEKGFFFNPCAFNDLCAVAKIANVYTRQYNFFHAHFCDFMGICHHAVNSIGTAFTTCQRNGTKSTFVVTTVLHFQKRTGAVAKRKGVVKGIDFLDFTRRHHAFALCFGECIYIINDFELLSCA